MHIRSEIWKTEKLKNLSSIIVTITVCRQSFSKIDQIMAEIFLVDIYF